MAVPQSTLDFIAAKEGFSPTAFWDGDHYSIGYGTFATKEEIANGTTISEADGKRRLESEAQKASDYVESVVKVPLSDTQKTALTSLAYNAGSFGSGLINAVNSGDFASVPAWMAKYGAIDPAMSAGVASRRNDEIAVWNGTYSGNGAAPAADQLASGATAPSVPAFPTTMKTPGPLGIERLLNAITSGASVDSPEVQAIAADMQAQVAKMPAVALFGGASKLGTLQDLDRYLTQVVPKEAPGAVSYLKDLFAANPAWKALLPSELAPVIDKAFAQPLNPVGIVPYAFPNLRPDANALAAFAAQQEGSGTSTWHPGQVSPVPLPNLRPGDESRVAPSSPVDPALAQVLLNMRPPNLMDMYREGSTPGSVWRPGQVLTPPVPQLRPPPVDESDYITEAQLRNYIAERARANPAATTTSLDALYRSDPSALVPWAPASSDPYPNMRPSATSSYETPIPAGSDPWASYTPTSYAAPQSAPYSMPLGSPVYNALVGFGGLPPNTYSGGGTSYGPSYQSGTYGQTAYVASPPSPGSSGSSDSGYGAGSISYSPLMQPGTPYYGTQAAPSGGGMVDDLSLDWGTYDRSLPTSAGVPMPNLRPEGYSSSASVSPSVAYGGDSGSNAYQSYSAPETSNQVFNTGNGQMETYQGWSGPDAPDLDAIAANSRYSIGG